MTLNSIHKYTTWPTFQSRVCSLLPHFPHTQSSESVWRFSLCCPQQSGSPVCHKVWTSSHDALLWFFLWPYILIETEAKIYKDRFTWGPQQLPLHSHSFQNPYSSPGWSWSSQHPTCWAPPWYRGCWTDRNHIQHQEHTPLLHRELQEDHHLGYPCSLQSKLCLHLARDLIH